MKTTKAKNPTREDCKKYELAITNYVLGQALKVPKETLWEHLKTCRACRRDFADWQDTYEVMKTEAYYNTPAGQQKMKESFQALKKRMTPPQSVGVPGRIPIDIRGNIKQTARTLYDLLKTNGETSVPVLVEKTRLKEYYIQQAIGWLGGNEKITLAKDDKTAYVRLLPE